MGARILVVGSMNMDLVVRTERVPAPGETLLGEKFQTVAGGKGANQAVAAARLGAETTMLAKVGKDSFGADLRENLAACGVNADYVLIDEHTPTGVALILVLESGNNSIVVAPGSNMKLTPDDLESVFPTLPQPDYVLLQFEIPMETIERTLCLARDRGIPCMLDTGPARPCSDEVLSLATIVSPNETEAEALTGVRIETLADAENAADVLHDRGAKTVVLKLGERGALISDGGEKTHVPSEKIEPVDTTAAGDAFTAALVVRLVEGADMAEAVQFANRAGALACLTLGAQPSMPTRENVENFSQ